MAKRSKKNQPTLTGRDEHVDAMFAGFGERLQEATNKKNAGLPSGATTNMLLGLPLPSFAARALFRTDSFPIGRTWELAGEEGSCKTSLLDEIIRWHCLYGGGGHIAETENKDAAVLRNGILEWNPKWMDRVRVSFCDSLEQWQSATTFSMTDFRDKMNDPKLKIGRTLPIALGIDSLTAVDTQGNIDDTLEAGHAKIGFSQMSNLIARYMRQGPATLMRDHPFSLIATNHMKPTINKQGIKQDHVVGGKAIPFASTIRIYMYRVEDLDTPDFGGIRVKMKMQKNSAGASRCLPVQCNMIWFREEIPGFEKPMKRFVWDWHGATVSFLLDLANVKAKKTFYNEVIEVCGIRSANRGNNPMSYSPVLGIPKSDPQPDRIVSQELEKHPEILEQLYKMFDIEVLPKFKPGVDYRELCAAAETDAAKVAESRYAPVTSLPEIGTMKPTGRDLNEDDDTPEDFGGEDPGDHE